jgi:AcrR family transcriptional regulator
MTIGKRSQKREETRQDILSAAAKLFSEKGYGLSSVEDIAAAAQVVKGTFYYNFSSKEDVVLALRHQSVQTAIAEAEELSSRNVSPLKCIEHYLVAISRWSEENPELASVLFSNGPLYLTARIAKDGKAGAPPAPPPTPPLPIVLKNLVCKAQALGEVRKDLEPAFVAALISFISMHTHLTWAAEGMQGSPSQKVVSNLRSVLSGLAASGEG